MYSSSLVFDINLEKILELIVLIELLCLEIFLKQIFKGLLIRIEEE